MPASDRRLYSFKYVTGHPKNTAEGLLTVTRADPSYREAQLCMEMIADTARLGSLDVVELNPALDVRNRTAVLAVDLIESLLGKSTLMRRPAASHDARVANELQGVSRPSR